MKDEELCKPRSEWQLGRGESLQGGNIDMTVRRAENLIAPDDGDDSHLSDIHAANSSTVPGDREIFQGFVYPKGPIKKT